MNVNATIQLVEWDTWLAETYSGRQFESTVVGVDASVLTASALLARFVSDAKNNFVNFNSAAYDAAYAKALASNETDQVKYFKECENILTEEAANVYIQDMANLVALNKKYGGYQFYPLYVLDAAALYVK